MIKNKFLLLFLSLTISFVTSCSWSSSSDSTETPSISMKRMKIEQSTNGAISMIEYQLGEKGYEASQGIASNGEDSFYGIVYSDFSSSFLDEKGNRYFECGFFQIVSDINNSGTLLTNDFLKSENLLVVTDGNDNRFVLTQTLPCFGSFSYIYDDWYNICKKCGDFVFEVNTYENSESNYDFDISCFSYDSNKWIFKSDEDIIAFNIEAKGFYSDYSKAYLQSASMFQSIIKTQNSNAVSCTSASYVIVSGEILLNNLFGQQKGTINGMLLSDLLALQKQLNSNEVLSITPDGIEVVADTSALADARVEKGIISLIANLILAVSEVAIIVVTWGSAAPIMAVALTTSISGMLYACSNIGEAIQDIALGAQGDISTEAINLIKGAFISICGSEEAGTIAYNIWGIANTIVSSLICPINAAITQASLLELSVAQTVLKVLRVVGVKLAEAMVVGLSSRLIGVASGEILYSLTGNELLKAYATDCVTLVAAFAIGFGVNTLDNKYNWSGISKAQFLEQLKRHLQNDVEFEAKIDTARSNAGQQCKKEALDDILNGGDPRKYGFDPSDPHDKEILDFVFENGRFPSYSNGDPIQCEFAHGVNVGEIKDAAYKGLITWEQALEFIGSSFNGLLTSHDNHLYLFHGGAYTNSTNYQLIIDHRPEVSDFIYQILTAIGAL